MPNSNQFYVTVITNKATDATVSAHAYARIGPAKARRTIARKQGPWDAKVFKCLYGLGCMTAQELDLE